MTEFQKLAVSELGYIYVKPTDTLVVEGRNKRTGTALSKIPVTKANSGYLLKEDGGHLLLETGGKIILNQTAAISLVDKQSETVISHGKDMANIVEATCYPRKIDTSLTVLYSLDSPISIKAGETKSDYKVSFRDAVAGAQSVSGTNMQAPVATTDYLMNTLENGTGTDKTANLTVTAVYGTDGAVYTLINGSANDCFITKLQARGYGIYIYDPISVSFQDDTLVDLYGSYKQSLDLKYQDDPANASGYSYILLGLNKNPITVIDSITFYANASADMLGAFLYCDISNKVHLQDCMSGVNGDYFINGVEFNISQNNIIKFTWIVKPSNKDEYLFWQLGTVGRSELGSTATLGFS
jgi:hypothetical protein